LFKSSWSLELSCHRTPQEFPPPIAANFPVFLNDIPPFGRVPRNLLILGLDFARRMSGRCFFKPGPFPFNLHVLPPISQRLLSMRSHPREFWYSSPPFAVPVGREGLNGQPCLFTTRPLCAPARILSPSLRPLPPTAPAASPLV